MLLIDDFLANGAAMEGLIALCGAAGATVEGMAWSSGMAGSPAANACAPEAIR